MRLRTTHLAIGIVLVAALQACGSDDDPPPKAICGLEGTLVAAVLGTNDMSESRSTDGALSDVRTAQPAFYSCDVKTDSYANAGVTAAIEPVPADTVAKMEQMPVRYDYEQGDAALEITSRSSGDSEVSSLDARWVCGRVSVRVRAASHDSIGEDDARALLESTADAVGCDPA